MGCPLAGPEVLQLYKVPYSSTPQLALVLCFETAGVIWDCKWCPGPNFLAVAAAWQPPRAWCAYNIINVAPIKLPTLTGLTL